LGWLRNSIGRVSGVVCPGYELTQEVASAGPAFWSACLVVPGGSVVFGVAEFSSVWVVGFGVAAFWDRFAVTVDQDCNAPGESAGLLHFRCVLVLWGQLFAGLFLLAGRVGATVGRV